MSRNENKQETTLGLVLALGCYSENRRVESVQKGK